MKNASHAQNGESQLGTYYNLKEQVAANAGHAPDENLRGQAQDGQVNQGMMNLNVNAEEKAQAEQL